MPSMDLKRGFMASVLALGLVSQSSAEVLKTNNLSDQGDASYKVNGADPYIVFKPDGSAQNAKYLILDISSDAPIKKLQLFFKPSGQSFNPAYRLDYLGGLDTNKLTLRQSKLALKLPESLELEEQAALRLDIDGCNSCLVEFVKLGTFSNTNMGLPELIPNGVYNGASPLPISGHPITLKGWRTNAVTGSIDDFTISDNDPYLVSPTFKLSTNNLEAVYFRLRAPKNTNISNDFQLFYATENHGFIEASSSHIRSQNKWETELELVFPLSFLGQGATADRILEKVRLDLPLITGSWSLKEAMLVSKNQAADFRHLWPKQLIENKRQRTHGLSLLKNSVLNVLSDLGFSVGYLLLLLLVAFGFLREFKK